MHNIEDLRSRPPEGETDAELLKQFIELAEFRWKRISEFQEKANQREIALTKAKKNKTKSH